MEQIKYATKDKVNLRLKGHTRRVGIVGHRPKFLLGYDKSATDLMVAFAKEVVRPYKQKETIFFTALAQGWDQYVAEACIAHQIKYVACIPFVGQERPWGYEGRKKYFDLLSGAHRVIVTDPTQSQDLYMKMTTKLFFHSNYIVDNATEILSLRDSARTEGGALSCINYAQRKGKAITNVWNDYVKYSDHYNAERYLYA